MAKIKLDTMELCDQHDMLKAHPDWKKQWDKWKNKHISAKDANICVDIVVVGINDQGMFICKLKYAKNETKFPKGWKGEALNETDFVLSNYKSSTARYTYLANLE